jgi:hypothetical protein
VRYIGCTKHIKRRYTEHLRNIKGHDARAEWIRGLQARGLKPGLIILEMVNVEAGAQIEAMWISMYRHHTNGARLVNTGWCYPRCPECRREYYEDLWKGLRQAWIEVGMKRQRAMSPTTEA